MSSTPRVGRNALKLTVVSTVTALVLGLTACGSTGPRISAANAPKVIHLSSAQTAGGKALPTAGALDGAMRPFGNVTYVFDGAYPALGATAGSWSFTAGATPDTARIAAIARALGASGDVRSVPTDQGGGWAVGPNDGTAPTFMVSPDAMLTWWFSSSAATVGSGCAVSAGSSGADPGTTAVATTSNGVDQPVPPVAIDTPSTVVVAPEPCAAPPAPHGVPDNRSAEANAKVLLGKMGVDATKYQFTTYADQYSASVNGQLLLDGSASPLTISIGFGAEGAITYASGQLAEPHVGDAYPLVTPEVGLQRLNDQSGKWQFFGGPGVQTMGGVAADAIATSGGNVTKVATQVATTIATSGMYPSVAPAPPATIVDPAGPTPMPSCAAPATLPPGVTGDVVPPPCVAVDTCGNIEPAVPVDSIGAPVVSVPACTIPAPQPITVHLNSVKLASTMVWAQDGTVWMLPAYTFTSTDGGEFTVVAVDEQYLDMSATTPVATTVVGPGTTTDGVPTPDTAVVPPDATLVTGSGATAVAPPTTALADFVALVSKTVVGLTLDEATKAAAGNGWQVRVVELDGVAQAVTDDFVATRIDVSVKAGMVTAVNYTG
jgi:hypothetical protein